MGMAFLTCSYLLTVGPRGGNFAEGSRVRKHFHTIKDEQSDGVAEKNVLVHHAEPVIARLFIVFYMYSLSNHRSRMILRSINPCVVPNPRCENQVFLWKYECTKVIFDARFPLAFLTSTLVTVEYLRTHHERRRYRMGTAMSISLAKIHQGRTYSKFRVVCVEPECE